MPNPRAELSSCRHAGARPCVAPLRVEPGVALSVDVEEWYHNCWVPEYVDPGRRPALTEELDVLLPQLLDLLAASRATATFFVLGEVARRLPRRVRELRAAGHEVACHGEIHQRASAVSPARFARDLAGAKARLEDLVGAPVVGYRAPEWSLRRLDNPRLKAVADLGFAYDSSLAPALGAGSLGNPRLPVRCRWADGRELVELPPFVWGGGLSLPAGGWCGRLAPPARLREETNRAAGAGRLPVLVVHPWELVDRGCPGLLTGLARLFHDAGRVGFRARFERLLRALPPTRALADCFDAANERPAQAVVAAPAVASFGLRPAVAME